MKTKAICAVLCAAFIVSASFGSLYARGQKGKEQTELLWYHGGGDMSAFPDIPDVFRKLNQNLAEMGRSYSVRFEPFAWGDYSQKMQLIMASGERADIVFMASWTGNYYGNAAAGYLTELDDLLDAQPKLKATMSASFWDAARVAGKIYAVPNYKDMVYQEYAAFNKEVARQFGIALPSGTMSYADMTPLLAQFARLGTDHDAYRGGRVMPFRGDFPLGRNMPIALSFAEPEKGFQVLTEMREYQDYVRLMRSWAENGYRHPDEYLGRNQPSASKKWFLTQYQGFPGAQAIMEKGTGVKMETRLLNGPPVLDNATPVGAMLSIPSVSTNEEQAIDFIAILNTDPTVRNLVGYGIEGVHYNLDDNGQVVFTEKGENNYQLPNFSLGSLLVLKTLQGEPLDAREQLRKFNEGAEPSPSLGFAIDKEKYKQVIAQAGAAFDPYLDSFVYGLRPADEALAEARGKLRELGWFEAVAEINRSYMDWKNNQ